MINFAMGAVVGFASALVLARIYYNSLTYQFHKERTAKRSTNGRLEDK